jgi:HAD superfamily hydrolase (TIGR01509 family)
MTENRGLSPVFEALLFDLGGVIIGIDWDRAFSRWAEASGEGLEAIRERYRFDGAYERHERGEIGELEYYASLRESLGIRISDEEFRAGWKAIFTAEIAETVELLRKLQHRIAIYAFSNSNPAHHAVWSKKFETALAPFRKVFVSSEMGLRKPDREAFEAISREIGVPLARILFFDDTLANVEGARTAGLQAVHVKSPQDVEDALRRFKVIPA